MPEAGARAAILAAVTAATEHVRDADPAAAYAAVERGYRTHAPARDPDERLALLRERLEDYGVEVTVCSEEDLPEEVASWVRSRAVERLVLPAGVPQAWLANVPEVTIVPDDAGVLELEVAGAVISLATVASADTGTVVQDGGPGQGRRAATLVPDRHLCVLRAEDVVDLVPEAIARVERAAREGRPITLVSGPSATSDIELERVAGVHGPRDVRVVVIAARS